MKFKQVRVIKLFVLLGTAFVVLSSCDLLGPEDEDEFDRYTALELNQTYSGQETFGTYKFTPPTTGDYTVEATNIVRPTSSSSLRLRLYADRSAAESSDDSQSLGDDFGESSAGFTVTLTGGQEYYLTALAVLTQQPVGFDLEIRG